MPRPVLFQSARDARDALARRELSSRELVELVLGRIEAIDREVGAVVELRAETALDEAAAADRALAAGADAPLLGVPVTVKEAFNVAGMHTTWGNPAFRDYVAEEDATAIARLKEAGAIVVAKTNAHFMLADFAQTFNEVYGTTRNPWDAARAPGGSSGGSAAAIAAGMSFLDLGSDLVGSIRIPASFCGVYGLRPSVGVVPLRGFQPPGPPAPPSEMTYLSAIGPLARSPADLRTALVATAGPEPPAARAYAWSLAPPRHDRLAGYRVGAVVDDPRAPVTSEVGDVLSGAVDAIASAGAKLIEGWPDGVDPVRSYDTFGHHVELFFAFAQPGAEFPRLAEVIERENERMALRAAWARYFEDVDVFVCPTTFTAAIAHDMRPFEERTIATADGERPYGDQAFWTAHAALAGLPALSAPAGRTAGGLPVGIQVVAPLFEDDTALAFAELLADVAGGYEPPPLGL